MQIDDKTLVTFSIIIIRVAYMENFWELLTAQSDDKSMAISSPRPLQPSISGEEDESAMK